MQDCVTRVSTRRQRGRGSGRGGFSPELKILEKIFMLTCGGSRGQRPSTNASTTRRSPITVPVTPIPKSYVQRMGFEAYQNFEALAQTQRSRSNEFVGIPVANMPAMHLRLTLDPFFRSSANRAVRQRRDTDVEPSLSRYIGTSSNSKVKAHQPAQNRGCRFQHEGDVLDLGRGVEAAIDKVSRYFVGLFSPP